MLQLPSCFCPIYVGGNFESVTYVLSKKHWMLLMWSKKRGSEAFGSVYNWMHLGLTLRSSLFCTQLTSYLLSIRRTWFLQLWTSLGSAADTGHLGECNVNVPHGTEPLWVLHLSSVLICKGMWASHHCVSTGSGSCKDIPAQAQHQTELSVHSHHAVAELTNFQNSNVGHYLPSNPIR